MVPSPANKFWKISLEAIRTVQAHLLGIIVPPIVPSYVEKLLTSVRNSTGATEIVLVTCLLKSRKNIGNFLYVFTHSLTRWDI